MPEAHFIGEILGCSDFEKNNLCCKWKIIPGNEGWVQLKGFSSGQTQIDSGATQPEDYEEDVDAVWMHPIDLHYSVSSLQGWPKIYVEVWSEDKYGTLQLVGYGTTFLPTVPNKEHRISCLTWTPKGNFFDQLKSMVFGTTPLLEFPMMVSSSEDRFDMATTTGGIVQLRIEVLLRGFKEKGAQFV